MKTTKQERASIEVMSTVKPTDALTKTMASRGITELDFPDIEKLPLVLSQCGITFERLAQNLARLLEAKDIVVYSGKKISKPNLTIQLKATELAFKLLVESKANHNHLHLHGAKLDELLGKTSTDQGES